MNLSEPFIRRPIMTTLVMISILFLGLIAFDALPVSDLPNVEYPTIQVSTGYPGASPSAMANYVTSPLERQFTAIDGIETISSSSSTGSSSIVLQFDLNKNLDAAAQDVQAALNRATPYLPTNLPNNPIYTKTNPAQSPIMYIAVTADSIPLGQLYEYAYTIIARRLGMIDGISSVNVYGSKSAIRIQVNPDLLAAHQIGLEEISNAIIQGNPQKPVGSLYGPDVKYTLSVDGQMKTADEYNELIIRNTNGALLKIKDIGVAANSLDNDKFSLNYYTKDTEIPCVIIAIVKQVGANTIKATTNAKQLLDSIKNEIPGAITLYTLFDQSLWIIESIHDVELTLIVAFFLVVIVVLFYLGKLLDTLIPILALPLSIIGTFGMMYLYGFTIDILSLLAITLSIGFLVDDAIVVLENITRHVEMGKTRWEAALNGSKEITFTVLSMTFCLVAIFIPLVFLGGIIGRIFREFAVTIVTAVLISGFISLSLTPMLCSKFIAPHSREKKKSWIERLSERINAFLLELYKKGLVYGFKHRFITLLLGIASFGLTLYLVFTLPTDFLPKDDLGFIKGYGMASDATSPYKTIEYQESIAAIARKDPNVSYVVSMAGIPSENRSAMFIGLKPIRERLPMKQVIPDLLRKFRSVLGIQVFLRPYDLIALDIGTGSSLAAYQYTLQGINTDALYKNTAEMLHLMQNNSSFTQVSSDVHNDAPYIDVKINRDRAYDLNVTSQAIELAFDFAYTGAQISLINGVADQYYVILEAIPSAYKDPSVLDKLYITASTQTPLNERNASPNPIFRPPPQFLTQVPLREITSWSESVGPLSIAHLNSIPATTISFDVKDNIPLGTALQTLQKIADDTLSTGIFANVQGSASVFKSSFENISFLFIMTIFLIYVILGILYENFIHPVTVMSALPPAGLGGLLTLLVFHEPISLYAFVGLIMLLGIVLKNGIMLVDFASEGIASGKPIF